MSALEAAFNAHIESADFPCIGAKAAHEHDHIQFFVATNLHSADQDRQLLLRIQAFASEQKRAFYIQQITHILQRLAQLHIIGKRREFIKSSNAVRHARDLGFVQASVKPH